MPTQPKARNRPWLPTPGEKKHQGRSERSKEYSSSRWQRFRKDYLQQHPLCELCTEENRVTAATVLDHKQQVIKGGAFYDRDNVRGLCYKHHQKVSALQRHGKTL